MTAKGLAQVLTRNGYIVSIGQFDEVEFYRNATSRLFVSFVRGNPIINKELFSNGFRVAQTQVLKDSNEVLAEISRILKQY